MKKYLVMILFLTCSASAQLSFEPGPKGIPKQEPRFIAVYRVWIPRGRDVVLTPNPPQYRPGIPAHYENRFEGFSTMDELVKWLNSNPDARGVIFNTDIYPERMAISEERLVAVYDVARMERLKLRFKKEEKIVEKKREVVTDEKKWTDTWWEVE